jgi:hypothetical protein
MRWRLGLTRGSAPRRQGLLPFRERAERLDRRFKRAILAMTALVVAGLIGVSPAGRYGVAWLAEEGRQATRRAIGLPPTREEIDALWRLKRERSVEKTREVLTRFYRGTDPAMQRLFQVAGMDPDHGLVRWGRADSTFLVSSKVFEPDDHGRSYRLRPDTRSIWLRQVTLHNGPFGLFQVPDTPEARAAAVAAGAIVDLPSAQSTNSWGCRGPEPEPDAPARGLVLGDSFMQGMFVGDDDTPPILLQRYLADAWKTRVSILNTGHIGYSPEQYYFSLREYVDRFRPHFVVVSVCPNDFGNEFDVMKGRGDWLDEAAYWIGEIVRECRGRAIPCLLAPVPCDEQIFGVRKDGFYPGLVCNLYGGGSMRYCDPMDAFIDEHLRLRREAELRGRPVPSSPLYNRHIADNHFSPLGAALWARVIGHRLTGLMDPPGSEPSASRTPAASPVATKDADIRAAVHE